jgi:hypothetical protein
VAGRGRSRKATTLAIMRKAAIGLAGSGMWTVASRRTIAGSDPITASVSAIVATPAHRAMAGSMERTYRQHELTSIVLILSR